VRARGRWRGGLPHYAQANPPGWHASTVWKRLPFASSRPGRSCARKRKARAGLLRREPARAQFCRASRVYAIMGGGTAVTLAATCAMAGRSEIGNMPLAIP
jgi:hypothetical protein